MKFGKGSFEASYHFEDINTYTGQSRFHLGLPQWSVPEWKGVLYQKDAKPSDFLYQYSRLLDCSELSSTFYTPVSDDKIKAWCHDVPKTFKFLPKWPKALSHTKNLSRDKEHIKSFLSQLELFDQNLGQSFLQLPPNFSIDFKRELFHFLEQVPDHFPLGIELRHSSWFSNGKVYPRFFDYIQKRGLSIVLSDTPSRRDVFHKSFSENAVVIRYLSDDSIAKDNERLGEWKSLITGKGLSQNIYFVLHRPFNVISPELVSYISKDHQEKIRAFLAPKQSSFF